MRTVEYRNVCIFQIVLMNILPFGINVETDVGIKVDGLCDIVGILVVGIVV